VGTGRFRSVLHPKPITHLQAPGGTGLSPRNGASAGREGRFADADVEAVRQDDIYIVPCTPAEPPALPNERSAPLNPV
jgi:hypothetical protein